MAVKMQANPLQLAQAPGETPTPPPAEPPTEPPVTPPATPPADPPAEPPAEPVTEKVPETTEELMQEVSSGLAPVLDYLQDAWQNITNQFFSDQGLAELAVIFAALIIAWTIAKPVRLLLQRIWPQTAADQPFFPLAHKAVSRLVLPILWVMLLWIGSSVLLNLGYDNDITRIAASLLNAWIVIRLFSTFVRDPLWSKAFATIAWIIAALNILRLLNPTIALLDSAALKMGDARLSLYMVLKGLILLVLLIWLAGLVARFVQARLSSVPNLTPSVQTLIGQTIRIGLLFGAVMLAMNAIGVDLTAFAVFSGAIGVGIGFGLQAIFSNLVAGIIMLLERTIKVGDFVELESGLTGEVREINTRATLVTTNDNVDILVPNSEFINNRVTNWTLREGFRRTRIKFGVAYGTDKDLVKKAALEAADNVPHMLTGQYAKQPQVWLTGFGDSSLDFELVVWLSPEAVKRPSAVSADYYWALETALGKYGIEIPFPQRDLHFRSGQVPINLTEKSGDQPDAAKPSEGEKQTV